MVDSNHPETCHQNTVTQINSDAIHKITCLPTPRNSIDDVAAAVKGKIESIKLYEI